MTVLEGKTGVHTDIFSRSVPPSPLRMRAIQSLAPYILLMIGTLATNLLTFSIVSPSLSHSLTHMHTALSNYPTLKAEEIAVIKDRLFNDYVKTMPRFRSLTDEEVCGSIFCSLCLYTAAQWFSKKKFSIKVYSRLWNKRSPWNNHRPPQLKIFTSRF